MFEQIALGRTDLVFDSISQGIPSTAKDEQGTSLIRWCAHHGDVSAIRYLLEHGETIEALGDNLDLNGAAFHGHWQLVQFLIEQGADVDRALDDTGETPLHAALCKANRPVYQHILKLLLAKGANPNRATQVAISTGSFMRDVQTKGETPLHRAAAYGTEAMIDLLIGAGAEVQAKDANGDSPLSWASWHLRPACILRRLCYGQFSIHPDNASTYDHGAGWGQLDPPFVSQPVIK